jgi:predicted ATPase/DNA-binding CsgD family transcriptional regulator
MHGLAARTLCEDATVEVAGQARLRAAGVTEREAEVLAAIGLRLNNREIAVRLFISVRTVESHVSALLRKLAVADRAALVALARQVPAGAAVPRSPTSFVGRDAELAEIASLLSPGQLVCLVGPAGCGKTRLALEVARGWPGEVRIVELAAVTAGDVSAVIAAGIGVGYEAADLPAAAQVALAGRSMLLVADNCDHVLATAARVLGELLAAVPGLQVLATSRQPLGDSAERVLALRPLPLPADLRLNDIQASPACQLFADRARAAAPGFALDSRSAPHVAAICGQLDGLPLAIELAAARTRSLDIEALADSIASHPALLEQSARTQRHRSLTAAIDWSWQLLDDQERALLSRLSALPAEFPLALAEAAWAGPPAADPRATLLRLADRSLVAVRVGEGEPASYRLLGVIRAFAAAHLPPAEADQVRAAHARYHRDLAARLARRLLGPGPEGGPAGVDAAAGSWRFDEDNMIAALAWSARRDPALADELLGYLGELVEVQPTRRAIETIRQTIAARPAIWSAAALARAGILVTYLSLDDADWLAGLSRERAADDAGAAYAGLLTGWVRAYRHEESATLRYLDPVIAYATASQNAWLEASAWQARGIARGLDDDAFGDWERAVARFVAAGDLMHANNVRYMLAGRAVQAGIRLGDVPVWLSECEAYASAHGLSHELAHARLTRASYNRISGRPDSAVPMLDTSLLVFRQAGDLRCVARTLIEMAAHESGQDPAAAVDLLLQALPAAAVSDADLRVAVLTKLVGAGAAAGNLVLAARCLGAVGALRPPDQPGRAAEADAVDQALGVRLTRDAYATYFEEGQAGGAGLVCALYPR